MKNLKWISSVVLVLSLFSLTGCLSLMTRQDVEEAQGAAPVASPSGGGGGSSAAGAVSPRVQAADQASRFQDLEEEVRALNGRLEVVENQNAERNRSSNEMGSESQKRVQLLQEELSRLDQQVQILTAEINALKTPGRETESRSAKKDQFQVAEEHFQAKEWRKAILSYQKFREVSPKDKRFSEATYKIGVSFQELAMADEAKTFFDEVISKFPDSAQARKAKTRLKNLKK